MNVLVMEEEASVPIDVQIDLAITLVPVMVDTLWLATNIPAMV